MISARLRPRTGLPRAEALLRGGADVALMLQWCILWEQHGVFDSVSVAVNWLFFVCVWFNSLQEHSSMVSENHPYIAPLTRLICKYKSAETLCG